MGDFVTRVDLVNVSYKKTALRKEFLFPLGGFY